MPFMLLGKPRIVKKDFSDYYSRIMSLANFEMP